MRVAASPQATADETAAIAPQEQLSLAPKISPEVDQLGGRLIILGFSGTQPVHGGPKAIRALIGAGAIAGVVIRRENVANGATLAELVRSFRRADRTGLLLVVAQETGGRNSYLTFARNTLAWPSQREIGKRKSPVSAHLIYQHLGASLSATGINVNLGPVLKLSDNPAETDSFGADVHHAAAFARAFILGHRDSGVLAVPVIEAGRREDLQVLETLLASSRTSPVAVHPANSREPGRLVFPPNLAGEKARFCTLGGADGQTGGAPAEAVRLGCDFLIADGHSAPEAARARILAGLEEALRDGKLSAGQFGEATERAGRLAVSVAGQAVRIREAFR
jgi:hypothetical protein